MVRFVIIGIVIAVAFTLYALVDAAMTDATRARGVGKPVWIVLIIVLPVIGAALWFLIGKGAPRPREAPARRPDDDPRFTGTRLSGDDLEAHMRDLEARLRELDEETFPGEERRGGATAADAGERGDAKSRDREAEHGSTPSADPELGKSAGDARPDGDTKP
ncbi:PLD nuclease N-terminal domain-containing protein [Leucobacter sp. USHLN153]|uniref:PLD nuclease N-terminal domain-containing protein n=1 Tax=Leucobacter sp. USHLN153 TaxID=3081268 RepID=UPI003015C545